MGRIGYDRNRRNHIPSFFLAVIFVFCEIDNSLLALVRYFLFCFVLTRQWRRLDKHGKQRT